MYEIETEIRDVQYALCSSVRLPSTRRFGMEIS
jgi:hypothetical protein